MKTLFVLLSIILAMNSCEKIVDTTWVYYDETSCSDAWGNSTLADHAKEKALKEYLNDKNIKTFEVVSSKSKTPEACDACHCKTGVVFECKIRDKHLDKSILLEFYQE